VTTATTAARSAASETPSTAVFTIVSKNYLHFARTLMQSIAEHVPNARRFVLLVDENRGEVNFATAPYEVVEIGKLGLPEPRKFAFRYTILEFNTAVKPWMFEWLFERAHADRVVYFDPDICLYRSPVELEQVLNEGAAMVLTPHLTGQLDDEHRPHELDIVRAGSYNLGFLALARSDSASRFLVWWKRKLEKHCVVDHDRGLFVDQKWLDLAPGMFEGVAVLRDEGYNVAYWNLQHRHVRRASHGFTVNGVPLTFYHFSGLRVDEPERLSKYQDRFRLSELPAVAELIRDYAARVQGNGAREAAQLPYAFGTFANGERIPDCIRQLYRDDARFQERAGEDPFILCSEYLNEPVGENGDPPITVLMSHIWTQRSDLQQAFPRILQDDRRRFAEWFVRSGAREMSVPLACIGPAERALSTEQALLPRESKASSEVPGTEAMPTELAPHRRALPELLAFDGAEFVMEAYQAVLGRPADQGGLHHFLGVLRNGGSKTEVVWRLRHSREGRTKKAGLAGVWPHVWLGYAAARIRGLARRGRRGLARRLAGRGETRLTLAVPVPAVMTAASATASIAPIVRAAEDVSAAAYVDWPRRARQRFGRSNYLGFYDWGDQHAGLVWIGRTASVRLPRSKVSAVRIVGLYDSAPHVQASGTPESIIEVTIDDLVINRFSLTRTGEFDVELKAPDQRFDEPVFLTITVSAVFVPAALGINADPRELSLRIARVDVDGHALLDFSCEEPYRRTGEQSTTLGINIVGYLRSEHGIGESARICAQAAEAAGLPFALYDFNVGNAARISDLRWADRIGERNPYPVNLFHVNADQMTLARGTLKEAFFSDRYNIGFWHWELPDFPDRFQSGFAFVDEVWVPSFFVMNAVSAKSPVPVVRIPHAIEFDVPDGAARAAFGLPEDRFLFLTMYDMHSAQGRKNPHAVIDAFRRAFPDPAIVALVVKVQNTKSNPEDFAELKRELAGLPDIFLIDRTMARSEVYALESVCDCFVSLHRSEGFGLGLAECMYLGKPVIGTNWSGNTDFMNAGNSCPVDYRLVKLERDYGTYYRKGNTWADPDVEHAARYMRKLVDEPAWRNGVAAEGQRTIRTRFSPSQVGTLYRNRLRYLVDAGALSRDHGV
jgi:glycosyltransferase involved in cell wall biosynthesis